MITIKESLEKFPTVLLAVAFALLSCDPEPSDDQIPFIPFATIMLDLNLPAYQGLNTKGYVYLDDGGVRGILLYKAGTSQYIAYERNCSYHPNDACATIEMHSSNLYIIDPCCNSTFELSTGDPTGGPAWRPLRQYETFLNGTQLTITDTILQ